ncbi:MAG: DUF433 domain-containing protein [Halobacteriales archaeon]|nr:DUF433 domain-containing protein [Halobacteriales archaeon]
MEQTTRGVVRDDGVMGGEPRIEGTRVTVLQIAALVEERGLDAQTVADRYDLGVADVYRALTYYHDNPDVIAEVRRERRDAEEEAFGNEDAVRLSDLRE